MKISPGVRGFTLVEFAVLIVMSGFILAAAINAYYVYIANLKYHATLDRVQNAYSSLSNYQNAKGAYACPSDPSLPITDINFGAEKRVLVAGQYVCWATQNLAVGACNAAAQPYPNSKAGSMCRVYGARHTIANPNPPAVKDIVLTGGLPYRSLKGGEEDLNASTCYTVGTAPPTAPVVCDTNGDDVLDAGKYIGASPVGSIAHAGAGFNEITLQGALDAWNYQMNYAVTENATVASTFGQGQYGAIDVQTEAGVPLLAPAGSSNFVIIAHGDDHSGAYTSGGVVSYPCANFAGQKDYANCNYIGNNGVYVSGLRSLGNNASHFDDVVVFHNSLISKLWEYSSVNPADIYNLNLGYVAVGTPNGDCLNGTVPVPCQELDVNGYLRTSTNGTASTNICDKNDSNCWSPTLIGGAVGASGNECPPGNAAGDYVMTGIVNGKITCSAAVMAPPGAPPVGTPAALLTCAAGQHAIGYSSSKLICYP